ncbi:MAG: Holliday junction resolvase RuvX [Acidobacteria bacterium 37-65-4]|nr:MAG: Holliday junction resolvase RuvX [Acidobacteria bacterium 37-65-4]
MSRVLAVDWGTRRIGVAVSDETWSLARSLPTLNVRSPKEAAAALADLARENEVAIMVLGDPVHMDGREGSSSMRVRQLVERLTKILPEIRYVLWDERLSSHQAMEILKSRQEKIRGVPGRLDQVAAALLLQSFLDSNPK